MATRRYTPPPATSPRITSRSRRSLVALEKWLAAAVDALVAAERAGKAALYRADGLLCDLARSLRVAKAALAEVRSRVADLDATREGA
jgi:hypothetical protein